MFLKNHFDKELIEAVLSAKKYTRILPKHEHGTLNNFNTDIAYKLYSEYNMPYYKIGMLYGISDKMIKNLIVSNHKIINRGHCCGKNSQNDYFEKIDTPDKAYFLGFIFADGSIVKNKKSYTLRIEINKNDEYILERFINYANLDAKIQDSNQKDTCYIVIGSKKIYDDLKKYNIVQDKCHKDPHIPDINDDLMIHFIRGYFDGDGIAFSKPKVGFCGSCNAIQYMRDYFINKYNLTPNKVTYNKSNHIYYIQWSQKRDIKAFYDALYLDKSNLYLERKYVKIKNNLAPIYGDI